MSFPRSVLRSERDFEYIDGPLRSFVTAGCELIGPRLPGRRRGRSGVAALGESQ
jgi:hypothetical protein